MGTSWGFTLTEGLGTWAPPQDAHSGRAWARGHLLPLFSSSEAGLIRLPKPPQAQLTHCGRGTQTITAG